MAELPKGQTLGKLQIKSLTVDATKTYRSLVVTDGLTNRSARVNGDWTGTWKLGDTIDVIWLEGEWKGQVTWKIWEPKADSGAAAYTPRSQAAKAASGMSTDEKIVASYTIAAIMLAGKVESPADLKNVARQAYKVMFQADKPATVPETVPQVVQAPVAPIAAPVQPQLMPDIAPTPAPVLPVDFDADEFEEDADTPF